MNPIQKLVMILVTSTAVGFLLGKAVGSSLSSLVYVLCVFGGLLVVPPFFEMIYKSKKRKDGESKIKVSPLSGLLFLVGIVLVFFSIGYELP